MKKYTQNEIGAPADLLDEQGHLARPGFCRRNYFNYNKETITKHRWRLKEWDYYMVSDGRFVTQLNFYNISYFAALTAEVLDLETGMSFADSVIEPSYPGKYEMSPAADAPFHFSYNKFGRTVEFITGEATHRLYFKGKYKGKEFKIDIKGERRPDQESLTSAVPFKEPHCFFYTQKLNCIRASGEINVAGQMIKYDPENTCMIMDWGRGVWPWKNNWYWSNGSGEVGGKPFGFELTWGFGIEKYAPQTAVFYDGKCHKIARVRLKKNPEREGFMKPWHFISEDGRLDLTMTPVFHRSSGMIFLNLLGMKSNQVFGKFSGHVVLDDRTVLEVKDLNAFAEKVYNRW